MMDWEPIFLFVGTVVAVWGVISQRQIARRRATLDLLAAAEADEDIIEARNKFIDLANQDGGLAIWAEKSREAEENTQKIKLVLNEFELISIGVQRGILDFELYSRWNKSTVLKYWERAEPFIVHLRTRTKNPAYYHEFQQMAGWLEANKMPRRGRLWALFF